MGFGFDDDGAQQPAGDDGDWANAFGGNESSN